METQYPDDLLFIEKSNYDFELPMEYAQCCWEIGKRDEAVRINEALIGNPNVPVGVRAKAQAQLTLQPAVGPQGQSGVDSTL